MRHVANIARPEWDRKPETPNGEPGVSIIVPARNEEESIRETLAQLLGLDYSNYEIIAVNDRSTDRTGQIMEELAASSRSVGLPKLGLLKVIHISELPSGWLGKTHAMWMAGQQASGEWLLFTDADVIFKPDSLRRAVAYANAERADHVVLFPRMIMKGPGERMMIAFFQMLFVFGHRPWRVADPQARDHMGVGAFNLVRRTVYEAVGTYRALRMEVIDDMKLGKGRLRHCQQSHQEFLCPAFFPVLANGAHRSGFGLSESWALYWHLAGTGMGASSLCRRARFAVCDLLRNLVQVGSPAILFLSASGRYHSFPLYPAALHGPRALEQRHRVAGDQVSAGRVAQGDSVR